MLLTPRRYGFSALFLPHVGVLFSRENIMEMVWGMLTRTLYTHLKLGT